jgi:hypothetical protein
MRPKRVFSKMNNSLRWRKSRRIQRKKMLSKIKKQQMIKQMIKQMKII